MCVCAWFSEIRNLVECKLYNSSVYITKLFLTFNESLSFLNLVFEQKICNNTKLFCMTIILPSFIFSEIYILTLYERQQKNVTPEGVKIVRKTGFTCFTLQ